MCSAAICSSLDRLEASAAASSRCSSMFCRSSCACRLVCHSFLSCACLNQLVSRASGGGISSGLCISSSNRASCCGTGLAAAAYAWPRLQHRERERVDAALEQELAHAPCSRRAVCVYALEQELG